MRSGRRRRPTEAEAFDATSLALGKRWVRRRKRGHGLAVWQAWAGCASEIDAAGLATELLSKVRNDTRAV